MLGEDMAEGDWVPAKEISKSALGTYHYDKIVTAITNDGFDPGYMFSPPSQSCRSISNLLTDDKNLRICRDQAATQIYEWVPQKCDLLPWDAKTFGESVRNKRVLFAGDSILKNLFQSLACQLESAGLVTVDTVEFGLIEPSESVAEKVRDVRKVLAEEGAWRDVHLKVYNATLRYLRSEWLVEVSKQENSTLFYPSLQLSDAIQTALPDVDLLILETGAWWNNGKATLENGRFFGYSDENFPYGQGFSQFGMAMWNVCDEITTSYPDLPIVWATSPMYHYNCHKYSRPGRDLDEVLTKGVGTIGFDYGRINAINNAIRTMLWHHKHSRRLHLLPMMEMAMQRGDSHPGTSDKTDFESGQSFRDCLHYCMPGVPDFWNQALLTLLNKMDSPSHPKNWAQ